MSAARKVTPGYMRDWGRHTHGSPLYAHLVEVIAADDELLRVINHIANSPPPNLLFAAVHYLLLEEPDHELAGFYASLSESPRSPDKAGELFREFILGHETEIIRLGSERYTQTNECRRCVVLLPAVMEASFDSFHLVDIGTSAGLNLALDRYHYSWSGLEWGPGSSVNLETELRGTAPDLHEVSVLSRTGLDLNPIDPSDPDQLLWLAALIWPEHHERRTRLDAAMTLIGDLNINFVVGDALETHGPTLESLPGGDPAVVMNSFALNQLTHEPWTTIEQIVDQSRGRRQIHRVSMEFVNRDDQWVTIQIEDEDGWRELGQGHPHGEWIELYARP